MMLNFQLNKRFVDNRLVQSIGNRPVASRQAGKSIQICNSKKDMANLDVELRRVAFFSNFARNDANQLTK